MSTHDRRAATAARFSSSPPAAAPDPAPDDDRTETDRDAALAPVPAELGRRIRGSYDLFQADYRGLDRRCAEAADALGEVRVTRQDAIEAAVRLIQRDETVHRRWVAELGHLARERR